MKLIRQTNVIKLPGGERETREQLLERLFNEHSSALRGFLSVRLGIVEDLDDIVQEVFVRLADLDNLQQRLPPGGARNRSFLFKTANNYVRDLERRRSVRRKYAEQQAAQGEEWELADITPESQAAAEQQVEYLKSVVLTLKPKCRDAFILNRFMDKSYPEVAAVMGLSVKQVEKYLQQALLLIREAAALERNKAVSQSKGGE